MIHLVISSRLLRLCVVICYHFCSTAVKIVVIPANRGQLSRVKLEPKKGFFQNERMLAKVGSLLPQVSTQVLFLSMPEMILNNLDILIMDVHVYQIIHGCA